MNFALYINLKGECMKLNWIIFLSLVILPPVFGDGDFQKYADQLLPPEELIQQLMNATEENLTGIATQLEALQNSKRVSGWMWHLLFRPEEGIRRNTASLISKMATDLTLDDLMALQQKLADIRREALLHNEMELVKVSQKAMGDISEEIQDRLNNHYHVMDQLEKDYMDHVYPQNAEEDIDEAEKNRLIQDFKCAFKEFEMMKEMEKAVQVHIRNMKDIGNFLIKEIKRGYGRSFGDEFMEKFKSEVNDLVPPEPTEPEEKKDKESSQSMGPSKDGVKVLENYEALKNKHSDSQTFGF